MATNHLINPKHSAKSADWMTGTDVLEATREFFGGTIELDAASDAEANERVKAKRFLTDALSDEPWPAAQSVFLNPPGGKLYNESLPKLFFDRLVRAAGVGVFGHAVFLAFSIEMFQTCQGLKVIKPGATPLIRTRAMIDYPLCVPSKRLKFVSRYAPEIMSHEDFIVALNAASALSYEYDPLFNAELDDKEILLQYGKEAEDKDDVCAMINARYKSSPTHANAIVYVPGYIDERERFRDVFSRFGAVRL